MKLVLSDASWLGLTIGNSRLHWALFIGETLCCAWDTEYLPASAVEHLARCRTINDLAAELFLPCLPTHLLTYLPTPLPLYIASVVTSQTALWQTYSDVHVITLDQVPLQSVYPTLGIDRALALWGAGETWGWPMLVIDAGTALTLTGADANRCLVGGAILPGVSLQLQSLAQRTSDLPLISAQNVASLPPRWALNTTEAIQSGIIYTMIAGLQNFIEAWRQEFPSSCIVITGGDRTLLLTHLQTQFPELGVGVTADPHLIFWGMRSYLALQLG